MTLLSTASWRIVALTIRCIENQLDVVHLPFVHHNTIGKGNKTLVNGWVIWENNILTTSANEVDEGRSQSPPECVIKQTI